MAKSSPLWAITTYFNPAAYERRLQAYRVFRANLAIPLVTIELGFNQLFSLNQGEDADILLQVSGADIMWQKERLLNQALKALPPECDKVAWLDCDILFEQSNWAVDVCDILSEYTLVQLFQKVHYLDSGWQQEKAYDEHIERSRPSVLSAVDAGLSPEICLSHPGPEKRPGTYANGMAWAAQRTLLDRYGFYDACIIGGGDRAISCAALGCFEHLREWHQMNDMQWKYYLSWAEPFFSACGNRICSVQGDIYHQWHGKASDRGLESRHGGLKQYAFNPFHDITAEQNGCWKWNSDKPELHEYLRNYFLRRKEDG